MKLTILKKGNDYSGVEDRLINFKSVAAVVGITPVQVALVMVAMKVSRIGNLVAQGKEPDNESIDDSSLDLCCYSVLNDMVIKETLNHKKRKK